MKNLEKVPPYRVLTAEELDNLDIKTQSVKYSKGKGGQKTNKKAIGGRASTTFEDKKFEVNDLSTRSTHDNQTAAKKRLLKEIEIHINKQRSRAIQQNQILINDELKELGAIKNSKRDKSKRNYRNYEPPKTFYEIPEDYYIV